MAFFEASPNPGYGPFILVTSAHSQTIANWDGSGDAVIGIHGPLGANSLIGTTGAYLSHGCIRLPIPDLGPASRRTSRLAPSVSPRSRTDPHGPNWTGTRATPRAAGVSSTYIPKSSSNPMSPSPTTLPRPTDSLRLDCPNFGSV